MPSWQEEYQTKLREAQGLIKELSQNWYKPPEDCDYPACAEVPEWLAVGGTTERSVCSSHLGWACSKDKNGNSVRYLPHADEVEIG